MNVFQGLINAYASPPKSVPRTRAGYSPRGESLGHGVLMLFQEQPGVHLSIKAVAKLMKEDEARIQRAITRLINCGLVVSCGRTNQSRSIEVRCTAYSAVSNDKQTALPADSKASQIYEFLRTHGSAPSDEIAKRLSLKPAYVHNCLYFYRGSHFAKEPEKVAVAMTKKISACVYKIKE